MNLYILSQYNIISINNNNNMLSNKMFLNKNKSFSHIFLPLDIKLLTILRLILLDKHLNNFM